MSMVSADEYYESAMTYMQRGDLPSAVRLFERAIFARAPSQSSSLAAAYNNRGNLLKMLGNGFDAVLNYERAIALEPAVAEYYQNRGATLADMGELGMAEDAYGRALELKPDLEHALVNLGNVYKITDRREAAVELYRKAIAVAPNYVDAHLNMSFALLDLGRFEEGWREYEWRWRSDQLPPRGLPLAAWNGEPVPEGQAILIYAEQGHGDAIQFMRYAPIVREKYGCRVYVEVRQPLARLVRTLRGVDGVVVFGEQVPADAGGAVAMMSLPRILGTTVETVPAAVPYLRADEHRAAHWRAELARLPAGLRVGVCWAGMHRASQAAAAAVDARRSMRLDDLAPLAQVPGASWVSLQLGPPSEQVRRPPPGMTVMDLTPDIEDFHDTAALVSCLDLVVTVDTAVAHLAGALGAPVWLVSRHDACWRWMAPSRTSPWYPTLKHYRQAAPGDWSAPVAEMRRDLQQLVTERSARREVA